MSVAMNGKAVNGNIVTDRPPVPEPVMAPLAGRRVSLSSAQADGAACAVCGDEEAPEDKKVPVFTEYPGMWACAECAGMAARRTGRPWWQNSPCDEWCHGRHNMRDEGPDRGCMSDWAVCIPLSLVAQQRHQHGDLSPQFAEIHLERGEREIEPRVVLVTPGESVGGLSLTLAEGHQLAEALSYAVKLAEGGAR